MLRHEQGWQYWGEPEYSRDYLRPVKKRSSIGLEQLLEAQTRFTDRVRSRRLTLEEAEVAERFLNPWMIGADPEFVCMQTAGGIKRVDNIIGHDGPIGYDHNGYVVEVRPEPARGAFGLIKKIHTILNSKEAEKIRGWKWRAGAYVAGNREGGAGRGAETLGGHVHFDFPPPVREQRGFVPPDAVPALIEEEENNPFQGVLDAQDRVYNLLEKLDIIPSKECAKRRELGMRNPPGAQYGRMGDWRQSNDGRHVEYRTYPSWLYHPHVAFLVLTLAKLAAARPELAKEALKYPSYKKLVDFVDNFKFKDSNARRVSEKMLEGKDLKFLQHDPDADMRNTWEHISGLER